MGDGVAQERGVRGIGLTRSAEHLAQQGFRASAPQPMFHYYTQLLWADVRLAAGFKRAGVVRGARCMRGGCNERSWIGADKG